MKEVRQKEKKKEREREKLNVTVGHQQRGRVVMAGHVRENHLQRVLVRSQRAALITTYLVLVARHGIVYLVVEGLTTAHDEEMTIWKRNDVVLFGGYAEIVHTDPLGTDRIEVDTLGDVVALSAESVLAAE